jgi:hypothetical protein
VVAVVDRIQAAMVRQALAGVELQRVLKIQAAVDEAQPLIH